MPAHGFAALDPALDDAIAMAHRGARWVRIAIDDRSLWSSCDPASRTPLVLEGTEWRKMIVARGSAAYASCAKVE